jgi:hypothetical protein
MPSAASPALLLSTTTIHSAADAHGLVVVTVVRRRDK